MKERIKIEEKLHIVIRDKHTKEVIKRMTIVPKVPIWKNILYKLLGKEIHATVSDTGKNQAAILFGGLSGYPVNCLDVYRGGWNTADRKDGTDINRTTESVGKFKINNQPSPWTTAGTYTLLRCSNTNWTMGDATNYHNEISINVTITSDQEWWAEVEFTFS